MIKFLCTQDIHFGEKFSREWSDGGEEPVKEGVLQGPKGLAGQLMRKHDSEAGRRAVRSRMQRVCKCHGEPLTRPTDKRLPLSYFSFLRASPIPWFLSWDGSVSRA